MKLFLAALTIWSLPFFGISCGSVSVPGPQQRSTSETVTLTNQKSIGSFPLQPDVLKNPPMMVEASVTKVVNPNARAVTIFVYLSRPNENRDDPARKITVGNFSLYPVDRGGTFMLDAADALHTAAETKTPPNSRGWRLVFELEQKPEQGSSRIEVMIEAPHWKRDKG
jgi:hypothetical protein